MKLLNHSPLKNEKLQFVGWVMDLSLNQTPAGIGDNGISLVIPDLVEDSPKVKPISISVQLERLSKVSIGQNRHCGAQVLQFVEGPFAPVIPGDGSHHVSCVFARCQFVQGPGNLHEQGINWQLVSGEP